MVLIIEVLLVFYIIYMVYLYIEDGQHRKGPLFVELECSACISSRLPPPLQRFALKGKYYFVGLTSNQTRTDFDLPAETPPVILRHSKTFFIWICVSKCNMYFTSLLAEVPLGSRGIPSCPSKALTFFWAGLITSECERVYFISHFVQLCARNMIVISQFALITITPTTPTHI